MADKDVIQGSLFEQGYLRRSLPGGIVNQPDTALTELVANAWDAGANRVTIFIPDKIGDQLIVEDDGSGLSKEEFYQRWMKLGYNRISHQGKSVVFPDGKTHNRLAYGRNGVGRHGLLCFNDGYLVQTTKNGKQLSLTISTNIDGEAIAITDKKEENKGGAWHTTGSHCYPKPTSN